jgi:ribosomal protein L35
MGIAMNKIRKSFLKRFKITKKGKILRQIAGQSHSFSKKPTKVLKRKKKMKLAEDLVLDYQNY